MANTSINTQKMKRDIERDFYESGATGNFLIEVAPVVNKIPYKCPIKIILPNKNEITSTHT